MSDARQYRVREGATFITLRGQVLRSGDVMRVSGLKNEPPPEVFERVDGKGGGRVQTSALGGPAADRAMRTPQKRVPKRT